MKANLLFKYIEQELDEHVRNSIYGIDPERSEVKSEEFKHEAIKLIAKKLVKKVVKERSYLEFVAEEERKGAM